MGCINYGPDPQKKRYGVHIVIYKYIKYTYKIIE